MTSPKIVSIGEVLFDVLPGGRQLGGAPANFAYHAGKLGAASTLVSAVGRDALGGEILGLLRQKGCSTDFIQASTLPTSTVGAVLDAQGAATYTIHQPVAWDDLQWQPGLAQLAGEAQAICFGTLAQRGAESRSTIRRVLEAASQDDCVFVCDVNLRAPFYEARLLEDCLRTADIVKLNEMELPVLAGLFSLKGDEEEQLKELVRFYQLQLVVLTKGADYSILLSPHEISRLTTPRVTVKDTVGAGDAFTAAVITGRLKGLPLPIVHRQAVELAAFVCTQEGGMPAYTPAVSLDRM